MPVQPPKALAPKSALPPDPLSASLEQEILAEKAATYGRLLRRLERALAALTDHANGETERPTSGREARPTGRRPVRARQRRPARATRGSAVSGKKEDLVAAAGEALWHVMVQRDLCGVRNHEVFLTEYRVPAAVRLRMGLVRGR